MQTKPRGFKLGIFQRRALYVSSAALFLSGAAWLIAFYFLGIQTEYGPLPSVYEPISLKIHGAAAPVFLLVFGALLPTHVVRAFRAGLNLTSGLSLLAFIGILIGSGYFLYYCGDEMLRSISSVIHSSVGLVAAPLLIFHIIRGRKIFRG